MPLPGIGRFTPFFVNAPGMPQPSYDDYFNISKTPWASFLVDYAKKNIYKDPANPAGSPIPAAPGIGHAPPYSIGNDTMTMPGKSRKLGAAPLPTAAGTGGGTPLPYSVGGTSGIPQATIDAFNASLKPGEQGGIEAATGGTGKSRGPLTATGGSAMPGSYTGTLTGAPGTTGSGPYGSVPQVPDPNASAVDSILNNIKNLGNIGQLTGGLTSIGTTNAWQPYIAAIPGISDKFSQASGVIGSLLGGNVPTDVTRNLQQAAAERGVATGQGTPSPNTDAAYLRALGLTSLDMQDKGFKDLGTLMGLTPQGPVQNPAAQTVTPQQQQDWSWLANLMKAAPDPNLAATTNLGTLLAGLNRGNRSTGGGGGNPNAALLNYLQSLMNQPQGGGGAGRPSGFPDPSTLPWNRPAGAAGDKNAEANFWDMFSQGTPAGSAEDEAAFWDMFGQGSAPGTAADEANFWDQFAQGTPLDQMPTNNPPVSDFVDYSSPQDQYYQPTYDDSGSYYDPYYGE